MQIFLHAQTRLEVLLLSFVILNLEEGGWSAQRFGRFIPGKTRYPLYRSLSGRRGFSERYGNLTTSEFDSRTFKLAASLRHCVLQFLYLRK